MIEAAFFSPEPTLKQIAILAQIVKEPSQIGRVSGVKYLCEGARPFGYVPQVEMQPVPHASVVPTMRVIVTQIGIGHKISLCPS
jgi:hypothetical protein